MHPKYHDAVVETLIAHQQPPDIGALIITYIILGVPYYKYILLGPHKPILIIKAPMVTLPSTSWASGFLFALLFA